MLYTAWKHQSAFVFLVFSGVWSGNIGQKAVKPIPGGRGVFISHRNSFHKIRTALDFFSKLFDF